MKQNVCSPVERTFRVVVGLVLLSLLFLLQAPYSFIGWVGLIPIATAIFRYCPISHMMKIDTCSMRHRMQ